MKGSRDQKKNMEKQIVPNARDEIKKLREALRRKSEDPGSADERGASQQEFNEGNGIKPVRNPDEQTADNFAAAQENRKKLKR